MSSIHKPLIDRRMRRRLVSHHLVLALISGGLTAVLYALTPSPDPNLRLSMATAYTGMLLLVATLFTGPLNVLRRRSNPVSTDLRRDIGVWAAIIGVLHVVVGLQVHMGDPWLYFFAERGKTVLRNEPFGYANYTGLAATIILVFLLALSNDYSLRKLRRTAWKNLQRLNYLLFILVVAHGFLYQAVENRERHWIVTLAIMVGVCVLFQVAGFIARVREQKPS